MRVQPVLLQTLLTYHEEENTGNVLNLVSRGNVTREVQVS